MVSVTIPSASTGQTPDTMVATCLSTSLWILQVDKKQVGFSLVIVKKVVRGTYAVVWLVNELSNSVKVKNELLLT